MAIEGNLSVREMEGKALAYLEDIQKTADFVIVPHNAISKDTADLVLDETVNASVINDVFTMLDNKRGNDANIAIKVVFMGGNIHLGAGQIVVPYDNFHLYGNGVKIKSNTNVISLVGDNIIFDGFIVSCTDSYGSALCNGGANCTISSNTCSSDGYGLYNGGANCTITGNTCSSYSHGIRNEGTNCIITGNTCSGNEGCLSNSGDNCTITGNTCSGLVNGLTNSGTNCTISGNISSATYNNGLDNYGTNCTISGNTCSSSGANGSGLYNTGTNCTISGNNCSSGDTGLLNATNSTTEKCIIIGNICIAGGISVKTGTCLPATREAMEDVNTGTITERQ